MSDYLLLFTFSSFLLCIYFDSDESKHVWNLIWKIAECMQNIMWMIAVRDLHVGWFMGKREKIEIGVVLPDSLLYIYKAIRRFLYRTESHGSVSARICSWKFLPIHQTSSRTGYQLYQKRWKQQNGEGWRYAVPRGNGTLSFVTF